MKQSWHAGDAARVEFVRKLRRRAAYWRRRAESAYSYEQAERDGIARGLAEAIAIIEGKRPGGAR